jgi:CBS domain-containing protein
MKIQQLMTRVVWTSRPMDSLDRAARIMMDHDCGSIVVVDDEGLPIAMLTDRDVCMAALKTRRSLDALKVADAMSTRLYACRAEDPVSSAQTTMALRLVRRLPVVDRRGHLVGLLSLDDIAREAARDAPVAPRPSGAEAFAAPITAEDAGRTLGALAKPRIARRT